MKNSTKFSLMILFVFGATGFAQEEAPKSDGWSYSLSFGAVSSPTYLGDDENQLSLFPNFSASYKDKLFASLGEGVGYNLVSKENLKAGLVMKYDFGRDEDGSNPQIGRASCRERV